MTEHPCKGMTKAEIAAFEAIAVNRPPHCSKRTLDKLLSRGVIEKYEKKAFFRDGLPPSIATTSSFPCRSTYNGVSGAVSGIAASSSVADITPCRRSALRQEQSFAEIAIYDQARCGTWGPLAIGARRAALRLISPSPQGDFESRHDRCN